MKRDDSRRMGSGKPQSRKPDRGLRQRSAEWAAIRRKLRRKLAVLTVFQCELLETALPDIVEEIREFGAKRSSEHLNAQGRPSRGAQN